MTRTTDNEVILTPKEWHAHCVCKKCGAVFDEPCAAVMHQDDCEGSVTVRGEAREDAEEEPT